MVYYLSQLCQVQPICPYNLGCSIYQVFVGNPLEEDCATAQKYIDEVIKRLLFLKKLDGYPVIRELDNDDEEEVSSLLDMNEIEKLAR